MASPAPASSPPAPELHFPASMEGETVRLLLPYHDATITGILRSEDDELTLLKIEALRGVTFSAGGLRMETSEGLKLEGTIHLDDISGQECVVIVPDDQVHYCRSCTKVGVPTSSPFSEIKLGTTFRFSGTDPYSIEVKVQKLVRRHSLTAVHLRTGVVLPYACIGDTVILRSTDPLDTWQGDIRYWPNPSIDRQYFERDVLVHVRDELVCIGPKLSMCLPDITKIFVKPVPDPPANFRFTHSKGVSQKDRRSSTQKKRDAEQKIKVAINGYGNIGRALARAALESEGVDLVAINDPSILDQMSCMFMDYKCDFEVKKGTSGILLFGDKEVAFLQYSDPPAVPWYDTGAQFFVETTSISLQGAPNYKSCMFMDYKCDFEVKKGTSGILLFGDKEVAFLQYSDPPAVPWYDTGAQFFVETTSISLQGAPNYKDLASSYNPCSDLRLFHPLEAIVGPCEPSSWYSRCSERRRQDLKIREPGDTSPLPPLDFSTTPNNSRPPVLRIKPVSSSDVKAVRECFPLWEGGAVGSVVRVQGVDTTFELRAVEKLVLSNTRRTLNFTHLVRWCFDMLSRIPEAGECEVLMSPLPRRM